LRLAAAALAAALLAGVAAAQTPPAAGVSGDPACTPSATDRAWMSAAGET
jgi:hypothetical protein